MLTTERLLLQDFSENDWPSVHEYASDPEVVRYTDWGPNTEQQTKDFIALMQSLRGQTPRTEYTLAVILKSENRLIGTCGLSIEKPEHREGALGYCYSRRFWGQGYATEAAAATLANGFGQLDLHRIYATCDVLNVRSWRVMEKIGMRREAHLREHLWQKDRWRDSFVYGILSSEWKP
jgi:RimJ/RimL family protein N-acetyltransferase